MYDDVPFDVFDDPDITEDPWEALYKEGSQNKPVDAATANYYVGRIKQNRAKLEQYKEQARQMKDDFKVRVETWLQNRQKSLDYDTQHCMEMLEMYFEANKQQGKKTLSLPEGNIGMYSSPAKYDFDTHEKEILAILQQNPDLQQYIRNKPEINRAEIRKAISVVDDEVCVKDGETLIPIPEIGYTPKTDTFSIR